MRLWHIDLVENGLLPKSQLIAQWRELNSIFKKEDKHILINYIYKYNKRQLLRYSNVVINELKNRKYNIKSMSNFYKYFDNPKFYEHSNEYEVWHYSGTERFAEHNNEYLMICYWNLREKYIRGQKDFTKDIWERLDKYVKDKLGEL